MQSTPFKDCQEGVTNNFYIAGLLPQTDYQVEHVIATGFHLKRSPAITVRTDGGPQNATRQTVIQPHSGSAIEDILLQTPITSNAVATDLAGNVLWYYPGNLSYITRPEAGGYFFGIVQNPTGDSSRQLLRAFDLAGITVLETNAARVSEQLVAMGKRPIGAFHHEARALPGGKILVLASVEQMMTGVQGPDPVDVLGDMIIVLDSNLQVLWAWDTFDHLDVSRRAVLREVCPGGCPPLYLAASANDWVHGNSVQLTPDGNLLYSARHQDWIIKIDYQNGAGTGDILWRLGKDGDFKIVSSELLPWFSHQHDPQFLTDNTTLMLYDNGNTRWVDDATAHSRGQVLQVDEQNRTVKLLLNADMGVYSFALGAAQKLSNGNYHFESGWFPDSTSMAVELDPLGQTVFAMRAAAAEYRSFRMRSLYSD